MLQPPQLAGSLPVVTQRPLQNELPGGQAQVPLVHEVLRGQMRPHTPQFALSLAVLVHTPEQFTWPGGQIAVHMRLTQEAPGAQLTPQAPQLRGSPFTSTQEPFAHCWSGGWQVAVQTRLEQTWLGAHSTLQAPQLVGSLIRSTQRPLQELVLGGQPAHMPLTQLWPARHTELQLPQLRGSLRGLTHWPLQTSSGRPQVLVHWLAWQASSGPHWLLQAPQLR